MFGPTLKRGSFLRQVVHTDCKRPPRDALAPADMIQAGFDNMRLDAKLVEVGRETAAQIVQTPRRVVFISASSRRLIFDQAADRLAAFGGEEKITRSSGRSAKYPKPAVTAAERTLFCS